VASAEGKLDSGGNVSLGLPVSGSVRVNYTPTGRLVAPGSIFLALPITASTSPVMAGWLR